MGNETLRQHLERINRPSPGRKETARLEQERLQNERAKARAEYMLRQRASWDQLANSAYSEKDKAELYQGRICQYCARITERKGLAAHERHCKQNPAVARLHDKVHEPKPKL